MSTLLVVILHDLSHFSDLLNAWKSIGVPGVTILQSIGGFQAESYLSRGGLGGLLGIFEHDKPQQRTLLSLINEENLLQKAIAEADRVVHGFDSPHSGILFTVPIGDVLGLKKWHRPTDQVDTEPEKPDNLTQWLLEEIKQADKSKESQNRKIRQTQIIDLLQESDRILFIVSMQEPLTSLAQKTNGSQFFPFFTVVNDQNRYMGLVKLSSLANILLLPIAPQAYTKSPESYEHARTLLAKSENMIAADVMVDSPVLFIDDELGKACTILLEHDLEYLPVVDHEHHPVACLSLSRIMQSIHNIE